MGDFPVFQALTVTFPEHPVFVGEERSWSADEVLSACAQLAGQLNSSRVVAVLADNSPVWAIADLACLQAGKVHLPLPAFFMPAQMQHALEQTGADTLLTDQPERIAALDLGFAPAGEWQGLNLLRRPGKAVDLPVGTVKISYTSGSTGTPKGVSLSLQGLADTALALRERLGDLPLQGHLAVLPLALLLENVAGIYAPLLRGAPVHLPSLVRLGWHGIGRFDPAALQACAQASQAQSLILVPELLKAWSVYLARSQQRAPESLSYVAVGGARVEQQALLQARQLGLPAYQGYGMTECGSVISLNRPGDDGDDVGRPLGHVHVRLENEEVIIRSRAFLGYLGHPAPTETEFASGDLGGWGADGHLQLSGRRKHLLINAYGRNISPEWVESTLMAQPAIRQAVVYGDARPYLVALLVPMPGVGAGLLADAVAVANEALPEYARINRFLTVPPFTLLNGEATGNGRPLRNAIFDHHAEALAALYF